VLFNSKLFSRFRQKNKQSFLDITKHGHEQYQDIIINDVVVKKANRNHDTESRYKIIREVLNQYRRPFCMLDIGASQGYFSFRAAHDYDCVCVMIEGNNAEYPKVGPNCSVFAKRMIPWKILFSSIRKWSRKIS